MIPEPEVLLTSEERARWDLTRQVAALHREGVTVATIMLDVNDGLVMGRPPPPPHRPRRKHR